MKNVKIDRDGYRYKWTVRGLNEDACIADIQANSLTKLSDYTATMFAEQYGCMAEVEQVRLMSHNQYQAYLQNNMNRLNTDKDYTLEDYRRDAERVEVLPFHLECFGLSDAAQELINKQFLSVSYTAAGDACFRCHVSSTVAAGLIANDLGCEPVCNEGFSGFYKSDKNRLILEFCDGAVSLLACRSQKSYAAQLAEYNRYYEIEDYDVCLEVYFDNVHMDNLFLPRENIGVAISSMLQRGYDGYHPAMKACWEEMLRQKKSPSLSFRVVEAPDMVRDIEFSASRRENDSVARLLESATARSQSLNQSYSGRSARDILLE